jgi:hypothetical protein
MIIEQIFVIQVIVLDIKNTFCSILIKSDPNLDINLLWCTTLDPTSKYVFEKDELEWNTLLTNYGYKIEKINATKTIGKYKYRYQY